MNFLGHQLEGWMKCCDRTLYLQKLYSEMTLKHLFQMRANNLLTLIGKAMGKSLSFESFEDFAGHSHNGKSKEQLSSTSYC
ncbi:hypothetical protein [Nostoc commune]|uniref:hypothetical protein n=1 Tax=Nostoc commune TaxID=1178 RepID=UPI0018C4A61E|nr:hypothetical protein [Nostoc commune]